MNTPGHYKCECARFFRRDSTSGQCQPDPAIYSQFAPRKPAENVKEEKKENKEEKEGKRYCFDQECHDQEDHDRYLEAIEKMKRSQQQNTGSETDKNQKSQKVTGDEGDLSEEDIKRLVVAFVICLIGTAAARGSIFWNLMFFLSIFLCGVWWASDKSDRIARSFMRTHGHRRAEL